jgi:hypothetical protein
VEENVQSFEPLRTEFLPAPVGGPVTMPSVPAGIIRLRNVGREAGKTVLLAVLLATLSITLAAVLSLDAGKGALVVWQEGDDRVLMEVP